MKESTRHNLILALALLMIAGSLAVYASWALSCLRPARRPPAAEAASPKVAEELALARAAFRASLDDPRAHLRLSEALYRAGRLSDAFYVELAARRRFGAEAFAQAHAEVVLGRNEARLKSLAQGGSDPAEAVRINAQLAAQSPGSAEGREALAAIGRLAEKKEDGPDGESARLGREALEELLRAQPGQSQVLETLGLALLARGDEQAATALAEEALSRREEPAGAYAVLGAVAFSERGIDKALELFGKAWSKDPGDLYSAAKLAQIYYRQRADREAALPYYLALYRHDPAHDDGEPAEKIILESLAARRGQALKYAGPAALGPFLGSEDAAVRAGACAKAGEAKDLRWIDALGELLDDDAEAVRQGAQDALFAIGREHPDPVRARREDWLSESRPLRRAGASELFARLESSGKRS